MPYSTPSELPSSVKSNLPIGAQKIYMGAFNGASKEGKSEADAAQIAWGAVKNKYRKTGDGKWLKKHFQDLGKMVTTPNASGLATAPMVRENLGGKKKRKQL